MTDPFAALGLPASPMLTDAEVREAWRAIAAATHPDRENGGNLDAYRAASAAYAVLRAPWGRTEAYADLPPARRQQPADPATPVPVLIPAAETAVPRAIAPGAARLPARVRYGRPARLALRVLAAAVAGAVGRRDASRGRGAGPGSDLAGPDSAG
jgi:hypothetical protein